MKKIIFLDCDGPVIPGYLYYTTDIDLIMTRKSFCDVSISYLNSLCYTTGARIVTNSMQNYVVYDSTDLKEDLIQAGILESDFHQDWRTIFPYVDYRSNPNDRRGWGRWLGIQEWIKQNGECQWICFDDRHWTDDPRLVLVDFNDGITRKNFEQAKYLLGSNSRS